MKQTYKRYRATPHGLVFLGNVDYNLETENTPSAADRSYWKQMQDLDREAEIDRRTNECDAFEALADAACEDMVHSA